MSARRRCVLFFARCALSHKDLLGLDLPSVKKCYSPQDTVFIAA